MRGHGDLASVPRGRDREVRLVSFVCEKSSQGVMPLSRPEGVARVILQKTVGRDCRGPKLIVRVWTETMVESRLCSSCE